jgi:hypothetical protein
VELRSVDELMDLLYACRGAAATAPGFDGPRTDPHEHALQTAALLRRRRPADKELQVAGLVQGIGRLLGPGGGSDPAARAADAVRVLLGPRVARLVRQQALAADPPGAQRLDEEALLLRHAREEARTVGTGAGVLEDWRTVLELVAARSARLSTLD